MGIDFYILYSLSRVYGKSMDNEWWMVNEIVYES